MANMNKNDTSSLLANVTFEDIMSEEAILSTETKRISASSKNSIKFCIVKNYGKLSKKKYAATFALVDWDGHSCFDLRCWSDDYSIPYKGITFSKDEVTMLLDVLLDYTYIDNCKPQCEYSKGNVTAKIFDVVGVLSSSTIYGIKWCKQVSIVDWGHGQKYDFRKWTEDYSKCSKGICLSQAEVDELITLLKSL